jgi:hypothetical protein
MVQTSEDALAKERTKTTTTTKKIENYRALNDQVYLMIFFCSLRRKIKFNLRLNH